jgi:transcriptional regulator with XRE-family HTH domain
LIDDATGYGILFDGDADNPAFKLEALSLRLSHMIAEALDAKGMNRADLARALRVSAPMVTKILSGRSNFTLKTLVGVAHALDLEFDPALRPTDRPGPIDGFAKAPSAAEADTSSERAARVTRSEAIRRKASTAV